jgi:hypothetical protein
MGGALPRVQSIKSGIRGAATAVGAFFVALPEPSRPGREATPGRSVGRRQTAVCSSTAARCRAGVVNRQFIYDSLARSERILIVETAHFTESEWCPKEAWFADAMAARRIAQAERTTLDGAAAVAATIRKDVESAAHGESSRLPNRAACHAGHRFYGRSRTCTP